MFGTIIRRIGRGLPRPHVKTNRLKRIIEGHMNRRCPLFLDRKLMNTGRKKRHFYRRRQHRLNLTSTNFCLRRIRGTTSRHALTVTLLTSRVRVTLTLKQFSLKQV